MFLYASIRRLTVPSLLLLLYLSLASQNAFAFPSPSPQEQSEDQSLSSNVTTSPLGDSNSTVNALSGNFLPFHQLVDQGMEIIRKRLPYTVNWDIKIRPSPGITRGQDPTDFRWLSLRVQDYGSKEYFSMGTRDGQLWSRVLNVDPPSKQELQSHDIWSWTQKRFILSDAFKLLWRERRGRPWFTLITVSMPKKNPWRRGAKQEVVVAFEEETDSGGGYCTFVGMESKEVTMVKLEPDKYGCVLVEPSSPVTTPVSVTS